MWDGGAYDAAEDFFDGEGFVVDDGWLVLGDGGVPELEPATC